MAIHWISSIAQIDIVKLAGKVIGYIRVSSADQNIARQLENITLDRVFIDQASGKNTARPALNDLMQFVRDEDIVIVHSMDRLARNLDDLRRIVKTLTDKGITLRFLKENLTFSGEQTPMANLMLSVMGAFAEFERALIRERQLEGIAIAKKKGIYKGRKPKLTLSDLEALKALLAQGEAKAKIARSLGISRETLYQYLKKLL